MEEPMHSGSGPEPAEGSGIGMYLGLGALQLVVGFVLALAAMNLARSPATISLPVVLSEGSQGGDSFLLVAGLALLSNVLMLLGGGMILIAVFFDLLHRYRATGKKSE